MNQQVGLAIAIHITLQMSIGKPKFSRCPAEGAGADVLPAWIGEGILAVQHRGDPQPIAPLAVEIGDRVPLAAGGIVDLIGKEVCSLSTAEPIGALAALQPVVAPAAAESVLAQAAPESIVAGVPA